MTDENERREHAADLRRRAEEKAGISSAKITDTFSREEMQQLVHELQVHQIELEMQNEELRRAQAELEASSARYFDLYDLAPVGYLTVSGKGLIMEANLTVADMLGVEISDLVKKPLTRFIFPEDQDIYYKHRRQPFEGKIPRQCRLRMIKKDGQLFWAGITDSAWDSGDKGSMHRVIVIDVTEQKQLVLDRDQLIAELQKAASEIKTLQGIIPICASCKKIRSDTGSWETLEKYFAAHSDAQFSHGICNECVKAFYPEHYDKVIEEQKKNEDKSG
jgi:PAS domain S-box-containing protein